MHADELLAYLDDDVENSNAAVAPDVPERFTDFCEWLGVQLYPGQRVLCRVAYDGVDPCDLVGEEREIAKELFGNIERIPTETRRAKKLVAVCGRGGGKTRILDAMKLLHAALTVPIHECGPGEKAIAIIIAPKLTHGEQAISFVRGAISLRPELQACVKRDKIGVIEIQRQDGTVSIACRAASDRGMSGRGFSFVWVCLDETAFFYGEDKVINDVEIYDALRYRLLSEAGVTITSTPWGETGLLYDKFTEHWEGPDEWLAAHAPTLLLNPSRKDEVEAARREDPDKARREIDAEFVSAGTEAIFDARAVREATVLPLATRKPLLDTVVTVGADFGFQRDSSALVAVELGQDNRYSVIAVEEIRPVDGPLKPSAVVKQFASIMAIVGQDTLIADQFGRAGLIEDLEEYAMYLQPAPEGAKGKAEAYAKTKLILHSGRLEVQQHSRLVRQMKEVTKRPTSGGGIRIDSPRWRTGGHGDIVTALVWAVNAASAHELPEAEIRHEVGTPNYHRAKAEKRKADWIEQHRRKQNQAPWEGDNSWILGP